MLDVFYSIVWEKIKYSLFVILFVALCIPLFFAVKHPESWSLASNNLPFIAKYVSSVLGYIGLALLTMELMLGTRAITGVMFSNLASKLSLHSKIGKYGVAFIFLHPALLAYFYADKFYVFSIKFGSEFEQHVTYGRLAFFGLLIIWLTSAVIRSKIAYRPWKYIHYLSYPVLLASLLHVPEIGSSFGESYIRFFWYVIVALVLVSLTLRMRHIFGFDKHEYAITGHKEVSENIWVMEMRAAAKKMKIKAGQYIYIQPNLKSEEHPFSVLNYNNENGTLAIGYKVYGSFTKKLAKLKVGDKILLDGPYGVFTKEVSFKPDETAVFIAGGIGITPFVKHCLSREGDHYLFYAVRSHASAAFLEILKPVLGPRLILVYSDENSTPGPNEEKGYVSKDVLKKYLPNIERHSYYLCGPSPMMKAVTKELHGLGVSKSKIHSESFSF